MTIRQKRKLQRDFFNAAGPNMRAFREIVDTLPNVGFYLKDRQGRLMALNRRNCEICNFRDELDAIGHRSDELFPSSDAECFMSLDNEVLRTGKPVVNRVTLHPADRSFSTQYSSVYPVRDTRGAIIGTMRLYHFRAREEPLPWHGRLKAATEYINAHYAEDISLRQLAEIAGVSVSLFKRAFAKIFETSPGKYLTNARLNAARRLLETTDKLISDIAQECGFYDQSHLTKAFKSLRGVTPGEYRRQHLRITSGGGEA